jgi:hypothetical protein
LGEAADSRQDQHGIGNRAGQANRQDVLAAHSLAEHEGILRADGDDQAEAQQEAGNEGGQHGGPFRWRRLFRYHGRLD